VPSGFARLPVHPPAFPLHWNWFDSLDSLPVAELCSHCELVHEKCSGRSPLEDLRAWDNFSSILHPQQSLPSSASLHAQPHSLKRSVWEPARHFPLQNFGGALQLPLVVEPEDIAWTLGAALSGENRCPTDPPAIASVVTMKEVGPRRHHPMMGTWRQSGPTPLRGAPPSPGSAEAPLHLPVSPKGDNYVSNALLRHNDNTFGGCQPNRDNPF
jgi:hypothetical protein